MHGCLACYALRVGLLIVLLLDFLIEVFVCGFACYVFVLYGLWVLGLLFDDCCGGLIECVVGGRTGCVVYVCLGCFFC